MFAFWSGRIEWPRLTIQLGSAFALLAFFAASTAAVAQSVGPDEIVSAGIVNAPRVREQLALTDAQKMAIYKAVLAQHVRRSASLPGAVPAAVGAHVSSTAELEQLPDQAANAAEAARAADLKYAMVEDDLVVVDPVGMRVIEVIHGNAKP